MALIFLIQIKKKQHHDRDDVLEPPGAPVRQSLTAGFDQELVDPAFARHLRAVCDRRGATPGTVLAPSGLTLTGATASSISTPCSRRTRCPLKNETAGPPRRQPGRMEGGGEV